VTEAYAYTGPTVVNSGTLDLNFGNTPSSGICLSSSLTINNGGTVEALGSSALEGYTAQGNNIPVTINAGGVLTVPSYVSGYAAHLFGILYLNGGTLANESVPNPTYGGWTLNNTLVVNGGPITSVISDPYLCICETGGTIFNITSGGANQTVPGVDLDVTGVISGTFTGSLDTGLILTGGGSVRLESANTYVNSTTISSGTLILGASGQLGGGTYAAGIVNNGTFSSETTAGQTLSGGISGTGTLEVNGAGASLTLSAVNPYTGGTVINGGALFLVNNGTADAKIASSAVITMGAGGILDVTGQSLENATFPLGAGTASQRLQGSGVINGSLTVGSLGVVAPGSATTIGALTVNNTATLGGHTVLKLNNSGSPNSDELVAPTLVGGGTLMVTNLGPALVAGNQFQLFSGPVSGFANLSLPVSDHNYKYAWTTNLALNGSIVVQSVAPLVNTNPATVNFRGVSGADNTLHFTWAADHQGWQLYTNSVGLTAPAAWYPWAGSSNGASTTITINPAQPQVFFQLRYP
jgi:autotransporter-associated beta strand protein